MKDEASIVAAARSGDQAAFRQLVEQYHGRVFGITRRLTGDLDAADDLAQEAFLRAYQALGSFMQDSSFGTWVVQIAVNAARDSARRESRLETVSLDHSLTVRESVGAVVDIRSGSDPFESLAAAELEECLESLITRLPPVYREAFVLRVVEGLSYAELAAVTGDSVGSIKVRVHRARGMLAEWLRGRADLSPPSGCDSTPQE